MTEPSNTLRRIAWLELFPWLLLFRSFRIAIRLRMLTIAGFAWIVTSVGWKAIGQLFGSSESDFLVAREFSLDHLVKLFSTSAWQGDYGPFFGMSSVLDISFILPRTEWNYLRAFSMLLNPETGISAFFFLLACLGWAILVWAPTGGILSRLALVEFTRDEQISVFSAGSFVLKRWKSYLAAPLFPIVGIFFLAIPPALAGLLMRIGLLHAILAILFPLFLILGLIGAILAIGLFYGWPLLWTAISAEGSDSFDAMSRTYAYVFQRPLQYFFYALVAIIPGLLGLIVVSLLANMTTIFTTWGLSFGASAETISQMISLDASKGNGVFVIFGNSLIRFWLYAVITLKHVYVFSFLWSTAACIYLLLRRDTDGAAMDELHFDDEEMASLDDLTDDRTDPNADLPTNPPNGEDRGGSSSSQGTERPDSLG